MGKYYQFTQKHFEFKLRQICIEEKIGFMSDMTEEIQEQKVCFEKVYKISTKNKSVDLVIFSSISTNSSKVRTKGDDAVRIVGRWKTKNGYFYKKLAKHYRIETLFDNMKKTLQEFNLQIFKLNYNEFTKNII